MSRYPLQPPPLISPPPAHSSCQYGCQISARSWITPPPPFLSLSLTGTVQRVLSPHHCYIDATSTPLAGPCRPSLRLLLSAALPLFTSQSCWAVFHVCTWQCSLLLEVAGGNGLNQFKLCSPPKSSCRVERSGGSVAMKYEERSVCHVSETHPDVRCEASSLGTGSPLHASRRRTDNTGVYVLYFSGVLHRQF